MPDHCLPRTGSPLLSLDQALRLICSGLRRIEGCEQVDIGRAPGRVLHEDLIAPIDSPPFTNAAMDGYAVRSDDTNQIPVTLRLVGTSWAGRPYRGTVAPGQSVRIFTGAALPNGADAVVMQEEAAKQSNAITLNRRVAPLEFVRTAGRDLARGQCALKDGKRLTPIDLGLIATLGISEIRVYRRLRVSLLASGDELRPPGSTLELGEIHDSNRYALKAFLRALGVECTDLGQIPDDAVILRAALTEASRFSDVIITIGGASVGDADYLIPLLRDLGRVVLWKVAIKPGKPFAFGRIGDCRVFGLPGNPVSAIVTFLQIVRPALLQMMGAAQETVLRLRAQAGARVTKAPGRLEFQRAVFNSEVDGTLTAVAVPGQDADRQTPLAAANCFLILPPDSTGAAPGDPVTIEPFMNYL